MRIAILGSRGYPSTYGGFETFVRRLAPWLVGRGHHVTVYGRGGARPSERLVDGIHVVDTVGIDRKATGTTTHGLTAAFSSARRRPDVVLALNVANGPALPVLRARRVPVVMNVDGIEWQRGKWGPTARRAFRLGAWLSARFSTRLVADSREVARVWRQEFGVDPVHIPYGADLVPPPGSSRIDDLGLASRSFALAVARLVPENNVDVFLDAIELLGGRVHGVVVGSANYRNPTEDRLDELQRRGLVSWLGHVSDEQLLNELWANCAAYFHGHSVGGTNPALLQALGNAAPVVAVKTPFNREVLGPEAVLVEPEPEQIAHRMMALVEDPDERTRVAGVGPTLVAASYRWDDVLLAYERLLAEAAQATT